MKILVTGNRGFIGKHLVKKLSEHEVLLFEWGEEFPEIRELDWVIHLGANSSTTETDVKKIMSQNYDFSRWILNKCIIHEVNFQYSSSASVYGKLNVFSEDGPVDPKSPYAWSKYLFDRHVSETLNNSKLPIRIQGFRYFNVYGPGEEHKGDQASPYSKFRKQALETGEIKIFENSENYFRDFIHVDDVVNYHIKFFNVKESGIWNIGTGKSSSFLEVAEQISLETGAKIRLIPMPENLYHSYQANTCADLTRLKNTLNVLGLGDK